MLMRYRWVIFGLALVAVDQLSKFWVAKHGQIFRNYHFAFSAPVPPVFMYLIYTVILILIVWYVVTLYKKFTSIESLAWVLIVSGAVSNIAERVATGYVKDFIYLFSGVFNLADFYILFGIVLLFIVRGKLKHTPEAGSKF
jgi:lipoprotein signal peptidase